MSSLMSGEEKTRNSCTLWQQQYAPKCYLPHCSPCTPCNFRLCMAAAVQSPEWLWCEVLLLPVVKSCGIQDLAPVFCRWPIFSRGWWEVPANHAGPRGREGTQQPCRRHVGAKPNHTGYGTGLVEWPACIKSVIPLKGLLPLPYCMTHYAWVVDVVAGCCCSCCCVLIHFTGRVRHKHGKQFVILTFHQTVWAADNWMVLGNSGICEI